MFKAVLPRVHLLSDGIMRKAHRGKPVTGEDKQRNKQLSENRYVADKPWGLCIGNPAANGRIILDCRKYGNKAI
ncbi:hypothetical protein [Neisseria iguanae]|uniref:Uncharacterized protein n=1 Tax=Neisseria iguanae TaxID=90242 RepID=A0A2P7U0C5_9NEIS|nr:hypothetical protein [Neisseria iguanae]PSJ80438.1 hypothetical protein C7N83_06215 [Neisseria iguanae]